MSKNKIKYHYHHMGIPTNTVHENERYSSRFKMYTADAKNSDFFIQWHRFEKDSPLPKLLKTVPHIAFKVENLDEAIKGKNVILEPYFPFEGYQVAIVEDSGIPIELIETKLSNEELLDRANKKSFLYPDVE